MNVTDTSAQKDLIASLEDGIFLILEAVLEVGRRLAGRRRSVDVEVLQEADAATGALAAALQVAVVEDGRRSRA